MPPLPLVPGVIKMTIGGVYHDTQWLNVYHVDYTGSAPSSATLLSYLTAFASTVATAYSGEMSVDNEITEFTAIDLSTNTPGFASYAVSVFGTRTGDFNPASVAMVVSHEIARRYRGGHPRTYLPWGTAGTFASGSTKDWDPAFVTNCQSVFAGLVGAFTGITEGGTTFNNMVNVSYRSGNAPRVTPVVDVVTSHIVRSRICSQRRRLGKVGG